MDRRAWVIAILRRMPGQTTQYAAALDNLGSLKADMGQIREARSLRIMARKLYVSIGDHAGTARASSNLALVALAEADEKGAHRHLADAFQEMSR